jgi:hypothetical protein
MHGYHRPVFVLAPTETRIPGTRRRRARPIVSIVPTVRQRNFQEPDLDPVVYLP